MRNADENTDHQLSDHQPFALSPIRRLAPGFLGSRFAQCNFRALNVRAPIHNYLWIMSFCAGFRLDVTGAIYGIHARTRAQNSWSTSGARNPPPSRAALSTSPARPCRPPVDSRKIGRAHV